MSHRRTCSSPAIVRFPTMGNETLGPHFSCKNYVLDVIPPSISLGASTENRTRARKSVFGQKSSFESSEFPSSTFRRINGRPISTDPLRNSHENIVPFSYASQIKKLKCSDVVYESGRTSMEWVHPLSPVSRQSDIISER